MANVDSKASPPAPPEPRDASHARAPLESHDPSIADYVSHPDIARGYDRYHEYLQGMFSYDTEFLREVIPGGSRVLDLGCGTGRHVVDLAECGHAVTGLDLSPFMLRETEKKLDRRGLEARLVQCDICDLAPLDDASFDCVVCMFSTLGLVKGTRLRLRALNEWRRVLVPGGLVALHLHNAWHSLRDAWGRGWLFRSFFGALLPGREFGDSWIPNYCGLDHLYLHLFRWREIKRMLRRARFKIERVVFLNNPRTGPYVGSLPSLKSNGFLIAARTR